MQTQQEQVLPFIYTPTVGEACQRYHELPIRTDGLYITLEDRGRMAAKLQQWPQEDIQIIVVTGALFRRQGSQRCSLGRQEGPAGGEPG